MQDVFIIGSKGIPGNYGGYETFVDKLTYYHKDKQNIKYHVSCKSDNDKTFEYNNWQTIGINGLTETTGIHNDLLKYFIDLGFVGFIVYLYIYLIYINKKISKIFDKKSAYIYFLLILFQILCWFTDNVSIYHTFLVAFFLLIFSLKSDTKDIKRSSCIEKNIYVKDTQGI